MTAYSSRKTGDSWFSLGEDEQEQGTGAQRRGEAGQLEGNSGSGGGFQLGDAGGTCHLLAVRPSGPSPQAIIPTLCQELGERVPFPVGQYQGHTRHRRGQTEQDNSQKQELREEVARDT